MTGHSACRSAESMKESHPGHPPPSVSPAVRRAALLELQPTPTGKQADRLLDQIEAAWETTREHYRRVVAKAVGAAPRDLSFILTDEVRKKKEGRTRVIDFPRLSGRGLKLNFDTRLCVAICVEKKLCSKVWSRSNLPVQGRHRKRAERLGQVSQITEVFRRLCAASTEWAAELVRTSIHALFGDELIAVPRGAFEVSALGIRDKALAPYFELVADTDTEASALLKSDEANKLFTKYLERIADLDGSAREAGQEPEAFWFSSDVAIELEDGRLEPRGMLYLMRPTESSAQVVGLGYDDSVAGDLAHRSAFKVAKWIATGV